MTDKREQNNGMDNQTAKMISQALAKDIGEIPEVSITVEELKELEQTDRRKRNRKRAKFVGVAAALILVCGVAAYAALPNLAVPVDADKNTEQSVEEGDGVVIINEGGAEGEGAVTTIEKDWNKVADMRKEFPDLIIPTYVPEGYEFVQLEVERYKKIGYLAVYKYQKENHILEIEEKTYQDTSESAPTLTKTKKTINTNNGIGYILDEKNNQIRMAVMYWEHTALYVYGNISQDEYAQIMNKIDMP